MGDQSRFRRLEESFHVLDGLDAPDRERRLAEIRREDGDLHAQLVQLFDLPTRAEGGVEQLDRLAREVLQTADEPSEATKELSEGATVGPYRLVRLLGAGGMGRVHEAVQTEPVERRVALKVMADGLSQAAVMSRFEAERQALAVMDHPNIARVFEVGAQDGRPWFAMELVDGSAITEWAERRSLSVRQRVELFVPICDAVQHAHLKGVIHRDLKPSNLLVTEVGGEPLPKIIDFGISKAIEQPLLARTLATRLGELVGTPEYMSPEQATLGAIDVDTRSDVYSLGLVLYELLVGELPLPREELRGMAFDELCRRIREDATPRPSQRLARRRPSSGRTHPAARQLRGDLDAVLQKALAKDREQRYASAAAFGEDLRRHLTDQPIAASAPSWTYRTRKFARRHRLLVTTGALMLTALLLGVLLAGFGFMEARAAREEALASAQEARRAQRAAESTSDFLVQLFRSSDPRENPGLEMTAGQLLDAGIERIDTMGEEPEVQAQLLETLGDVSWALGAFERAEPLLRRAIDLRRSGPAVEPVRLAFLLDRLAGLERDRSDLVAAETLHREALAVLERQGLGESQEAGRVYNNLGIVLRRSGRPEEAAAAYERGLRFAEAQGEEASGDVASSLVNLAAVYQEIGEVAKALETTEEAFALFVELLPEGHPHFGTLHNNLAVMHLKQGSLGRAAEHAAQGLAIDRQALPAEHPILADDLLCVGRVALRRGRFDDARAGFEEALAIQTRAHGPDHFRVHFIEAYLGSLALAEGDPHESRRRFERALRILENSDQPAAATHRLRVELPLLTALRRLDPGEAAERAEEVAELAAELEDRSAHAIARLQLALAAFDRADRGTAEVAWEEANRLAACESARPCPLDGASAAALRAHWWTRQGDEEQAFETLHLAIEHPLWRTDLLDAPDLERLHGDPRWQAARALLARRIESSG